MFIKIPVQCFGSQIILKSCVLPFPSFQSYILILIPFVFDFLAPFENSYSLLFVPGVWKFYSNELWCGHFFIYCARYLRVFTYGSSCLKILILFLYYFLGNFLFSIFLFSFSRTSVSLKINFLADSHLVLILIFPVFQFINLSVCSFF